MDGQLLTDKFKPVPGDADYAYAQVNISEWNHTLKSQLGFSAYVYGYGNNESFGFATGASRVIVDLVDSNVGKQGRLW